MANLSIEVGNGIIIKLGNGSWFATLLRVVWNSWEVVRAGENGKSYCNQGDNCKQI